MADRPNRFHQWLRDWGTPAVVVAVGAFLWVHLDGIESDLKADIGQVRSDVREVRDDIANVRATLDANTAALHERIDQTNERIDQTNKRIDRAYDYLMAQSRNPPPSSVIDGSAPGSEEPG